LLNFNGLERAKIHDWKKGASGINSCIYGRGKNTIFKGGGGYGLLTGIEMGL
jgi:hypothetical protein